MKRRRLKFDVVLAEAVQEGLNSISTSIPPIVFSTSRRTHQFDPVGAFKTQNTLMQA